MARGVAIELDAHEVAELGRALRRASRASLAPVMQDIAAIGKSATQARIAEGGPAPDGTPWPERHPHNPNPHPLLNLEGHLWDSIQADSTEDEAIWGSNLVYSRIHQLGGTITPREAPALSFFVEGVGLIHASQVVIPPRPYLGFGEDERAGVEEVVELWLEELFGEGSR